MAKLFEFVKRPEKHVQTGRGEAFCMSCQHTWVAVAPTGTTQFECPSCHRVTGHFRFAFAPNVGQMRRVCNCGNEFFYLTPQGHMCASCGIWQEYD